LYDYTMMGVPEQDANTERWNFDRFHPQVVVVFVGINDFQGEPPYADVGKFKQAYVKLLDRLRALHPGVKFLLVATKTWPNDDLGPVVEGIYKDQVTAGKNDLLYKFVYTENTALHGHPSEVSQKELANTLRPLVARLGGWLSR
jgi:lysophospholipase L1-like esterase